MILKLTEIITDDSAADDVLTLPFDLRQKSRLQATTDNGRDVGLFLSRGQILRSGTLLTGPDKIKVEVRAATEAVSVLRSDDSLQFAKACYHLGNRHVPLQILAGELRFLTDHVLDHMLQSMGLQATHEMLPFDPEAGAYHSHEH